MREPSDFGVASPLPGVNRYAEEEHDRAVEHCLRPAPIEGEHEEDEGDDLNQTQSRNRTFPSHALGCPMMSQLAPPVALRFGPTQTRRVGRLPR